MTPRDLLFCAGLQSVALCYMAAFLIISSTLRTLVVIAVLPLQSTWESSQGPSKLAAQHSR